MGIVNLTRADRTDALWSQVTQAAVTAAPRLNEDIDHVSVLIHGTPQILPFTGDRDEDFVREPCISESTLSSLQAL